MERAVAEDPSRRRPCRDCLFRTRMNQFHGGYTPLIPSCSNPAPQEDVDMIRVSSSLIQFSYLRRFGDLAHRFSSLACRSGSLPANRRVPAPLRRIEDSVDCRHHN